MSLDVYLTLNACPTCGHGDEVYSANITHNLGKMARAVSDNFYYALWHPDEKGWKTAQDITPIVADGLDELRSQRSHYEQFNSPNGWGLWENFVPWVERYLAALREHPDATVTTST